MHIFGVKSFRKHLVLSLLVINSYNFQWNMFQQLIETDQSLLLTFIFNTLHLPGLCPEPISQRHY